MTDIFAHIGPVLVGSIHCYTPENAHYNNGFLFLSSVSVHDAIIDVGDFTGFNVTHSTLEDAKAWIQSFVPTATLEWQEGWRQGHKFAVPRQA